MNLVAIAGNIGRDPEGNTTQGGTYVLKFSVAVNERVKKGDRWEDATEWVNVVVFGKRAEGLQKILGKGHKVAVHGKLRTSSWERDGQKRYRTEVIAEGVTLQGEGRGGGGARSSSATHTTRSAPAPDDDDFNDDDIPF